MRRLVCCKCNEFKPVYRELNLRDEKETALDITSICKECFDKTKMWSVTIFDKVIN